MFIKNLILINYRNYNQLDIEFSKNVNVFIGNNAQGKTNVLEAIYYCCFAKSHRTSKDRELIRWDCDDAYISIQVGKERLDKRIDINILKNGKKAIKVNKLKINKIGELFGNFNVVMFSPEDLRIIKDSPGIRRRFIDMEICQLNNKYYYSLVQYNKIINERNIILKNRKIDEDMLDIYDTQLAMYGEFIMKERIKYLQKLNHYGSGIHKQITSQKEEIQFKYISSIRITENIQEEFINELKRSRRKDIDKGMTTVGIHRDDFSVHINNVEAKTYGSQGQQRTAILTMKFASLNIIKEVTGEYPILLLDDVLSELDDSRKKYILSSINNIQTIITCTGNDNIDEYLDSKAKIFKVTNGKILK